MRSNLELRRVRSSAVRYAFAAASVGIATGLALISQYYQFHDLALPLLTMSVALTAWYTGNGPAVPAVVLSTACFSYFFAEPIYSF